MAKSLGQIHTVNLVRTNVTSTTDRFRVDLSGELTKQLQRQIRQGQYYKLVGLDMSIQTNTPASAGKISGFFRYYAPTMGRCAAYRAAFKAMADTMKLSGINMRDNAMYDFRVPLTNTVGGGMIPFANQATMAGAGQELALNDVNPGRGVFQVYNQSVQPKFTGTPGDLFGEGFVNRFDSAGSPQTDFVSNDEALYTGNEHEASLDYELIPFEVAYSPSNATSGSVVTNFEFRPDPALYIAILTGQLELILTDVTLDAGAASLDIQMAWHVAGWKSIMGNPKKKTSSKKRNRK